MDGANSIKKGALQGSGLDSRSPMPRPPRFLEVREWSATLPSDAPGCGSLTFRSAQIVFHPARRTSSDTPSISASIISTPLKLSGRGVGDRARNALRGKRKNVFLASKTLARPDTSRRAIMLALEGSLRRLQTDHVDVIFQSRRQRSRPAQESRVDEFAEAAKKQGKLRFTGIPATPDISPNASTTRLIQAATT